MNYVLGFIFSPDGKEVLLMRKNRPEWQSGRLNGIGGKIEEGESPLYAMVRKTGEETTAIIPWSQYGAMKFDDAEVHLFYGFYDGDIKDIKNKTDEQLETHKVNQIPDDVIPNLHWLIPMALKDNQFYSIVEI